MHLKWNASFKFLQLSKSASIYVQKKILKCLILLVLWYGWNIHARPQASLWAILVEKKKKSSLTFIHWNKFNVQFFFFFFCCCCACFCLLIRVYFLMMKYSYCNCATVYWITHDLNQMICFWVINYIGWIRLFYMKLFCCSDDTWK